MKKPIDRESYGGSITIVASKKQPQNAPITSALVVVGSDAR